MVNDFSSGAYLAFRYYSASFLNYYKSGVIIILLIFILILHIVEKGIGKWV